MKQFTLQEIEDTFLMKVLPNTKLEGSCLVFLGGRTGQGYGSIHIRNIAVGTHRVAYAYYNNTNNFNELFILHSCDNPKCISKDHLRLGTHRENMQDMIDRSRSTRKFTDEEIKEIYISTEDTSILMQRFNVTRPTINTIRSGKEWSEITKGLICGVAEGRERSRDVSAILTKEQVQEIYLAKDTLNNLAKKFNTDITTISKIKCGVNWKDVTAMLGEAGSSEHPFKAKLTKETVKNIYLSKELSKVLAERYNITARSVNHIRAKETWKIYTDTLDNN